MRHPLGQHLQSSSESFLKAIFDNLERLAVDVGDFILDHICYRVETEARYKALKESLSDIGTLLGESIINGRLISNYKLYEPIKFRGREISVFELPAPKKGSHYSEGYEHVEFVTPFTLEELMSKHPELHFDKKDLGKARNRDIRLSFGNISVKFHEQSLEQVIAGE